MSYGVFEQRQKGQNGAKKGPKRAKRDQEGPKGFQWSQCLISWSQSFMVTKCHVLEISWSQSSMVSKSHSLKVQWSQNSMAQRPMVSKSHGPKLPKFHDPMIQWSQSCHSPLHNLVIQSFSTPTLSACPTICPPLSC